MLASSLRRTPDSLNYAVSLFYGQLPFLTWRRIFCSPLTAMVSTGACYPVLRSSNRVAASIIRTTIFSAGGNGATRFTSIHRSIDVIGAQLAKIRCYKGKDLNGFLRTYNPVGDYPGRVKKVMRSLDPQFRESRRILLPQSFPAPQTI